MRQCDRCGTETRVTIMSKFNIEIICMECKGKEREHPSYAEADRAECESIRRGNYNFPGIGKPADLV